MSLFVRRGRYSDEETWERVHHDRHDLAIAAVAAGAQLPKNFQSLGASAALSALETALPGRRHRAVIRQVFEANGPFGDHGTVRLFALSSPIVPPTRAPLAGLIDTEINSDGPFALAAEGKPLVGECWLYEAAMEGRQAVYGFVFVDMVMRKEVDPMTREVVMRERREPADVDALLDPDRAMLAVHGGTEIHARRVATLIGQALSTPSAVVTCTEWPHLTDPMMHALIDGFEGWIPGGRVEPLNVKAAPISYGTRDLSESRRNQSNLRIRREGEHIAVRGAVPLSQLSGRGRDRVVHFTINRDWTLGCRTPIEPLMYFRLADELVSLLRWREWSVSVTELAAQGLRTRLGAAATDMDVQDRADLYISGVEQTMGAAVPIGLSEFRRRIVLVDIVNAVWRVAPNAAALPSAKPVQLSTGLRTLFDDLGQVRQLILTRELRSAVVRAIWRALEQSGGKRAKFLTLCQRLSH